jgi:hypothetical protein
MVSDTRINQCDTKKLIAYLIRMRVMPVYSSILSSADSRQIDALVPPLRELEEQLQGLQLDDGYEA